MGIFNMTVKKRGLGRNLSALLGGGSPTSTVAEVEVVEVVRETKTETPKTVAPTEIEIKPETRTEIKTETKPETKPEETNTDPNGELRYIPIEKIQPGQFQPRQEFDQEALEDLANSIRAQGVIQPIVVRPLRTGGYEIIAGERRWRGAQIAGLEKIPAVIRELDDFEMVAMALIENIQREDLNPIEEARALHRLLHEFDLTHEQVAQAVGKSRSAVSNSLRLMGLQAQVKNMVEKGMLEMGHARALLTLDETKQLQAANMIMSKNLSVRETENLVKKLKNSRQPITGKTNSFSGEDPNLQRLQNNLSETLKAMVSLQHSQKGKGKIIIRYNSVEELEGILKQILKSSDEK